MECEHPHTYRSPGLSMTDSVPLSDIMERTMKLNNLGKEMVLLSIIADMRGSTDASDSPHSWLNWFCNDEAHGEHSDTFNRCIEKGWLRSSHDTSFDTSTAWLTDAGKAVVTAAPASTAEPVWQEAIDITRDYQQDAEPDGPYWQACEDLIERFREKVTS